MKKQDRQDLIKKIIANNVVFRQEDLVLLLKNQGIDVTQATISRDIKELHLVKIPTKTGEYRYSMPTSLRQNTEVKLKAVLKDAFVFADYNKNQVVIKVLPGNGPIVSELVDAMNYPGTFATLGDDNTVMIFTREESEAYEIYNKVTNLVNKATFRQ